MNAIKAKIENDVSFVKEKLTPLEYELLKSKILENIICSNTESRNDPHNHEDEILKKADQKRLDGRNEEAGDLYILVSEEQFKLNDNEGCLQHLNSAFNCFKEINNKKGIPICLEMISYYEEHRRFSMAAKFLNELGFLEEKLEKYQDAISSYEKSSKYHIMDNKPANARAIQSKIANIHIKSNNFLIASQMIEMEAKELLSSTLGKFSFPETLLLSILCKLTFETPDMKYYYTTFEGSFKDTRQDDFIVKLISSIQESSVNNFDKIISEYKTIHTLKDEKLEYIFNVIKRNRFTV